MSMSSASFRECFLSLKPEAIIEPINILSALGKSAKNKLTLAPPLGMVVTIMFLEMIFILIFFRKKRKRRTFVLQICVKKCENRWRLLITIFNRVIAVFIIIMIILFNEAAINVQQ